MSTGRARAPVGKWAGYASFEGVSLLNRKGVIVVIILAVVLAVVFHTVRKRQAEDGGVIKSSGTVEVTELQLSPLVGGRLTEFPLREGDRVESGDLVCRLSPDGLDHQVRAKEAAVLSARERLRQMERGSRPEELRRGESELRAQTLRLNQAERDARRYAELQKKDLVSRQTAESFEENARVLREAANVARQNYILLKKGPRQEELAQQKELIKQLEADLAATRLQLSYKEVFAPASGLVLTKNYEAGEVVSPGTPILNIGLMEDAWVKVYIPATQLARIKPGQRASIYLDGPGKEPISGHIKSISQEAEFNPRLSLTQRERANQVFWVKVAISGDTGLAKPGMPADVVFENPESGGND